MCFRPPNVSKPKVCPSCGATNPPIRTTCLKCNVDLNADKAENKEEKK